jgi:DNA polymerase (family 10)
MYRLSGYAVIGIYRIGGGEMPEGTRRKTKEFRGGSSGTSWLPPPLPGDRFDGKGRLQICAWDQTDFQKNTEAQVQVEAVEKDNMENTQIANIFDEIADLLELRDDNPSRIRAYRRAARTIRKMSSPLEEQVHAGRDLSKIPTIGAATATKIHEVLKTGNCKRLNELRETIPAGLIDMMGIPGVGPRSVMQLHQELGVQSLEELVTACQAHRVRELAGFGPKSEQNVINGITAVDKTKRRILYLEAASRLDSLKKHLDGLTELNRWYVAGSFRRGKETIGDLDILVHANNRKIASDAILRYEGVTDVISRGNERVSVRLGDGFQVDFRFFNPSAFGAAWLYFTGSKAHNIQLRRIAQDKGWKLNEYGLFKADHRLASKTEAALYKRLGMDWIPPELRENLGEIKQAMSGQLPRLVTLKDIRGDIQCHTTASDGKNSIKEMADAARKQGLTYLAITDHPKPMIMANGLDHESAQKHADAIRTVNSQMKGFWLMAGIEVDVLKNNRLDLMENTLRSMDWVVASIHSTPRMSKTDMTNRILAAVKSGLVHCLGHPLGRIIGQRDPIAVDMDSIIEACLEYNVALGINCQPNRLDIPVHYCRDACDAGVRFALGTDAHSATELKLMPLGVTVARRRWLRKENILNTLTIAELQQTIRH